VKLYKAGHRDCVRLRGSNSFPVAERPNLIRSVHETLSTLAEPAPSEPLKPAVSTRKSVTDEYIVSLEDMRKFKPMTRYLSGLGVTLGVFRANTKRQKF
jgi:predicted transcriptional regulator